MNNSLIIIGAGGHGRVVADIAMKCGYKEIAFLDDINVEGIRQIGKVEDFLQFVNCADFIIAIGNNQIREKIFLQLKESKANIVTLQHPNAVIADNVTVGEGVVVMAGAVINVDSVIGDGVIVNTSCSIDHDCIIGAFTHVSVGSHLAGNVHVGEKTFIGAGATVINNINIYNNCMIGAGAVVINDIADNCIVIGCPAKPIE